jgi:hypothetical protein
MELHQRTGSHGSGRAQRFTLHLPVLYRTPGQTGWHSGVTENISDSGAAIRTDESIAPATPLTVVISLPSIGSERGGRLIGEGRVVRNIRPSSATAAAFALTVKRFQLDRSESRRETVTP